MLTIPRKKTDTNAAPYFDDYDPSKGFHQILFRPKAIQARELNQLQAIMQDQINRFGRHIFEEGSVVIPGGVSVRDNQNSVGVTLPVLPTITTIQTLEAQEQLFVKSSLTNLKAKVLKVIPASGADPVILYLEYENSGTNNTTKKFTPGENLVLYYTNSSSVDITVTNMTCGDIGNGLWVKCLSGVYFARGYFVLVDDQDIVVAKLISGTRSCRVGFRVIEDIVTEAEDDTLFSNALGETNFRAEGATRLKITLELVIKELADVTVDTGFIEILQFENGAVKRKIDSTQYSQIEKVMAQRTFEESGNYTVTPFGLDIKEHLKTTAIDGVATLAEGGDEANFAAIIKPGVGYIAGYRVENVGNQTIIAPKARATSNANNSVTSATYGSYLLVNTLFSLPPLDIKKQFLLRDVSNATVGTCAIRAVRKESLTLTRLYVFDLAYNVGKSLADVKSIAFSDATNSFSAILQESVLFEGAKNSLVFQLPHSSVKTLKQSGSSDTSYAVMRSFNAHTSSGTNATAVITLTGSEVFGSLTDWEWFVGFTGAGNTGETFPVSVISIGGSPTGTTVTVDLGTSAGVKNKDIRVIAPVIKQVSAEKTKSLLTLSESITFSAQNSKTLTKADAYAIVSVTDNSTGNDLTNYFKLDSGQREAWYEMASLKTSDGIAITRAVTVVYKYFEHSAGDYFSVDSYVSAGILRKDIPSVSLQGRFVSLADCIDFRPLKNSAGVFSSLTVFGEIIRPDDTIRADVEFYLDRMDTIFVDSFGNFDIATGESGPRPNVPKIPDGTMRLYDLFIPAYTSDIRSIKIRMSDNRRYTMRDIGKLDKRIENVEYYVSLSMLETKASNTQIIDPTTGNARFKNGFAVDGFADFSLADTFSAEWAASIDTDSRVLHVPFVQNGLDLSELSKTNAQKITDIYTLPFTEEKAAYQPYATRTININPYAVFTWSGSLVMRPSSDFWKDVVYFPPVVINKTVNNRGNAQEGTTVARTSNSWWNDWWIDIDHIGNILVTDVVETVTTTTFGETNNSEITADTVLSSTEIPYMRALDIACLGKNFKPFTRLYPFFEGVDVSAFMRPLTGVAGDPIISDAAGSFSCVFAVPSTEAVRFKTGTSVIRFTDNATDSRDPNTNLTSGQGTFFSGGTLTTRQKEITNTRTLTAATSSNTTTNTSYSNFSKVQVRDPIAQSFRISNVGGGFITKVDIAFATKAAAIPVTLQIRTLSSGVPSELLLPFGEKSLLPSQVNVSTDGSAMTSFVFDDPVFLEEGKEYAIVLLADTQEYNVFIAQMGQNVIGQDIAVSKQPHVGVFFQSSNGSTWTPSQEMDMKFTIWKALFNTGVASEVVFKGGTVLSMPNEFNSIETVNTSATVTAKILAHGLKAGDSFTMEGASAGNGFTVSHLNKVHVATVVNGDYVSFVPLVGNNATSSGYIGGTSIKIKANYPFGLFFSNFERMVLPGTDIQWQYSYKAQGSRTQSAWINFTPNTNTKLVAEGVVLADADFKVRAVLSSTNPNISPVIDTSGMTTVLVQPRINTDEAHPFAQYVTKDVVFNNPSTSSRFFVAAKLPNSTYMKFFYKLVNTPGEQLDSKPWIELASTVPLSNNAKFAEYEYQLSAAGGFIGYKTKIMLLGSDVTETPELKDYRSIALA